MEIIENEIEIGGIIHHTTIIRNELAFDGTISPPALAKKEDYDS